jgi:hypothetical protein
MKSTLWYLVLFSLLTLVVSSCSNNQNSAPASIEEYINALVNKDENALIIYSCADWESEAKSEFNSFSAVSVSLEDLACQETGQDGDYTIVSCEGVIIANYGNEVLEINLADQNYLSIFEGGEWRMCGYH